MRPPVHREQVLARAAVEPIGAPDLRDLLKPRRASQYLYKLHKAGWLERVGGDGTKECPYTYRAACEAPPAAPPRPFDCTGLSWLTAA